MPGRQGGVQRAGVHHTLDVNRRAFMRRPAGPAPPAAAGAVLPAAFASSGAVVVGRAALNLEFLA